MGEGVDVLNVSSFAYIKALASIAVSRDKPLLFFKIGYSLFQQSRSFRLTSLLPLTHQHVVKDLIDSVAQLVFLIVGSLKLVHLSRIV